MADLEDPALAISPYQRRVLGDAPTRPVSTFVWPAGARVVPLIEMQADDEWVRVRGPDDAVAWCPQALLERSADGLRLRAPYCDGALAARHGEAVECLFGVPDGWVLAEGVRGPGWIRDDALDEVPDPDPPWPLFLWRWTLHWIGGAIASLLLLGMGAIGALFTFEGLFGDDERRLMDFILGTITLGCVLLVARLAFGARRGPTGHRTLYALASLATLVATVGVAMMATRPNVLDGVPAALVYGIVSVALWRRARARRDADAGVLPTPPMMLAQRFDAARDGRS